jgi:hypothetical protein
MSTDLSQFTDYRQNSETGVWETVQLTREEVLALRPSIRLAVEPAQVTLAATGETLAEIQLQVVNGLGETVAEARTLTLLLEGTETAETVTLNATGRATLRLGTILRPGIYQLTVREFPGTLMTIKVEAAERIVTTPNVDYVLLGKNLFKFEQGNISEADIDAATLDELRAMLKWLLKQHKVE